MSRVRRVAVSAAIAGAVFLPFGLTTSSPAVAYCENRPIDDGGSGCSNSCQDTGKVLNKISQKLADQWNCPQ